MRDPQGRFDFRRGVAIKASAFGGSLLFQALLLRKGVEPSFYKLAAVANFGCAGALGGLALHNTSISTPTPMSAYPQPH